MERTIFILSFTLIKRLAKFTLQIEPNKTRLVEFGRFSHKHAIEKGKKMETVYFLGFTHYCTRNRKGNFMVGRKTEKTRLKRSMMKITDKIREIRHCSIEEQVNKINQILRGHYNYYGMGGNINSLFKLYNKVENYFKKMLGSRSWKGKINWDKYSKIKEKFPLLRPKLSIPYEKMKAYGCCKSTFEEPGAGNLHAWFCGGLGCELRNPSTRRR